MPNTKYINLFIGRNLGTPSFSPLDSDSLINALHIEQLIGTLVRLSPNGRYEGYLADGWSSTPDKKSWLFTFRKDLVCEDGTPINAKNYKHGIELTLKLFTQHTDVPILQNLIGYNEYKKGLSTEIKGIESKGDLSIQFNFQLPTGAGFIEYLGLPFMGFYCRGNFNESHEWEDKYRVISSASYRLAPWDQEGPVTLLPRNDWKLNENKCLHPVILHRTSITEKIRDFSHPIILSFDQKDKETLPHFQVVKLLPTVLNAISLSTSSKSPFREANVRKHFQALLKTTRKESPWTNESALETERFYPDLQYKADKETTEILNDHSSPPQKTPVRVLAPPKPGPLSKYILDKVEKTLTLMGFSIEIISQLNQQHDLMTVARNPKAWDIRLIGVDIGGGIENQLIKFMFCSNLGASFPDPSGRICNLVSEYEKKFGDAIPKMDMEAYLNRFDQIIEEDAAVFPILKSGKTWLLSPDFTTDFLSPTTAVPFFDLIKFK